jgi:hypothetical protein
MPNAVGSNASSQKKEKCTEKIEDAKKKPKKQRQ